MTYQPWRNVNGNERGRIAQAVKDEYGLICWLCHKPIPGPIAGYAGQFTIDHVIPDSFGGGHDLANLRPAHRSCNSARGNRRRLSGRVSIGYLGRERRDWTAD